MPDSTESRLARLEQRVSAVEEDIRSLVPMLVNEAEIRSELSYISREREEMRRQIKDIRGMLEADLESRKKGRITLYAAGIGLFGAFVSSTITALVSLL